MSYLTVVEVGSGFELPDYDGFESAESGNMLRFHADLLDPDILEFHGHRDSAMEL